MPFELFDRKSGYSTRQGNLPHWYQPGVTYFITFRTADSVPRSLLETTKRAKARWLRAHGIDPALGVQNIALERLSDVEKQEFHRTFTVEFDSHLDRGHGACVLRRPELAKIVTDSFHRFDNQRYHLGDYVVMPNHVHLLCGLLGNTDIEAQCDSWKHFTARKINRELGRTGRFWQEESFDHLVRSPEQFDNLCRYIAENPRLARLRAGEFIYYRREVSR